MWFSLRNCGPMVSWTTMGSNEQFVRQRRGGGHSTTDIRYVIPIFVSDVGKGASQLLYMPFDTLSWDISCAGWMYSYIRKDYGGVNCIFLEVLGISKTWKKKKKSCCIRKINNKKKSCNMRYTSLLLDATSPQFTQWHGCPRVCMKIIESCLCMVKMCYRFNMRSLILGPYSGRLSVVKLI
jgi:hypothetical protein